MDALTATVNTAGPSASAGTLDPALVATIVGAAVTGTILALIVARAFRLHRTGAARRSIGRTLPDVPSRAVLIEPKPRQFQHTA